MPSDVISIAVFQYGMQPVTAFTRPQPCCRMSAGDVHCHRQAVQVSDDEVMTSLDAAPTPLALTNPC